MTILASGAEASSEAKCPPPTSKRTDGVQNPQTFREAFLMATAGIVAISAVNVLGAQAPQTRSFRCGA